ncbi:MFS transporter [Arthrobacter sp. NPDC056691]|uniref:MFS transporter n=1 Tax=Arthrobacter sp. NPDC056691 TaxID=3345913 RepID=UPI003671BAF6
MKNNDIPPTTATLSGGPAEAEEERTLLTQPKEANDLPKVGAKYIWFILLGLFGAYIALVTPMALSLAIRIKELAPNNEEYLGYIIGSAAVISLFSGPIAGVLSDRTCTRFGRRRPWLVGGAILGTLGLFVIATSPNLWIVAVGWVITTLGWNTVIGNFTNSQADRLPESQRGKVGGLVGFITMAAPVAGSILGGMLATDAVLLFMVPGVIGVILVLLFAFVVREEDSRGRIFTDKLDLRLVLSKFAYNPRQYPDFSWNWLGRFLFYFGLTLNSTFTAFYFAQRLNLEVTQIGGLVAVAGLLGVAAVIAGSIGGGFLSDRLRKRKSFVLTSGAMFSVGAVIMALSDNLPMLLVGSAITNLGLGIFSAVDQALVLDVLPERDTDAGRFVGINGLANSLAQSAAPLVAPLILGIGATSAAEKSYSLLYFTAAAFTVGGGLVVLKVKAVR